MTDRCPPRATAALLCIAMGCLTFAGCAASGPAADRNGLDPEASELLSLLTAASADLEREAVPLQNAFRETIHVGMSQDEVTTAAAAIAANAPRSEDATYEGNRIRVDRSSSGEPACFSKGEPSSRATTSTGAQVWDYKCGGTTFVLVFQDGRLDWMDERPTTY